MYKTLRKIASVILITMLLGSNFAFLNVVQAWDKSTKIKICHATNAQNNPYGPKIEKVSVWSIIKPKWHNSHNWPVWYPWIDKKWWDIIPPFGNYPWKNWTEEGQAIWNNDCQIPPYCWDWNIDTDLWEECDGWEHCSEECTIEEYCWDEIVNWDEECDGWEHCSEECTIEEYCWDEITNWDEECDGWEYCSNECTLIYDFSCPFSDNDWIVVYFDDARLRSDKNLSDAEMTYNIPTIIAGNYNISLASADWYPSRASTTGQINEIYKVVFENNQETNSTEDLADWVEYASWDWEVNSDFELTNDSTQVTVKHSVYPDTSSANSVMPICMLLEEIPEETGSINGFKWNDLNNDGKHCNYPDIIPMTTSVSQVQMWRPPFMCEPKLEWWTITITWESYTGSTTTDSNWNYSFNDIPVGDYIVCEEQKNGWEQTFPDNKDGCHHLTVNADNNKHKCHDEDEYNFGNHKIPTVIVVADKVICEDEADLPNWWNYWEDITENTLNNFLDNHPDCWLDEDWDFKMTYNGETTTFKSDVEVEVVEWKNTIKIEEVEKEWYIPFTWVNTTEDVSAELYCHTDVLYYDNWDNIYLDKKVSEDKKCWKDTKCIEKPKKDVYYCIAFNVPKKSDVTLCKEDKYGEPLEGWNLQLLWEYVEQVTVPTTTWLPVYSSELDENNYVLISNGVYDYGNGHRMTDANFSQRAWFNDPWLNVNDLDTPYEGYLWNMVNNWTTNWSNYQAWDYKYALWYTDYSWKFDFRVLDNYYNDNVGDFTVDIYEGYAGTTGEDWCVTFEDVPYWIYGVDETLKIDWENISWLWKVIIDDENETFTVVNEDTNQVLETPVQTGYNENDEEDSNSYPTPRDPNEITCTGWVTNINGISVHWNHDAWSFDNVKYQRQYAVWTGSWTWNEIYSDLYTNYRTFWWNPWNEWNYSSRVRAFVDWNSNGVLDSEELVSDWSNTCEITYELPRLEEADPECEDGNRYARVTINEEDWWLATIDNYVWFGDKVVPLGVWFELPTDAQTSSHTEGAVMTYDNNVLTIDLLKADDDAREDFAWKVEFYGTKVKNNLVKWRVWDDFYKLEDEVNCGVNCHMDVFEKDWNQVVNFDFATTTAHDEWSMTLKNKVEYCNDPFKIVARKIVCEDEADLPNNFWGELSQIKWNTAQNWVDSHESCELAEWWNFEYWLGSNNTEWVEFWPTNSEGKTVFSTRDYWNVDMIKVREVEQEWFINFSNWTWEDPEYTAEIYCGTDIKNYDNEEWIRNEDLAYWKTVQCVAWNVPNPPEPLNACENTFTVNNYNDLYIIDLNNWVQTQLDDLAFGSSAAAADPDTWNIYYINNTSNNPRLAYYDITTYENVIIWNVNVNKLFTKLAFDENWTLFGMTETPNSYLYTIDINNANTTLIGATPNVAKSWWDLVFDNHWDLYVMVKAGKLYRIDYTTWPSPFAEKDWTVQYNWLNIKSTWLTFKDWKFYVTDNAKKLFSFDINNDVVENVTLITNKTYGINDLASCPVDLVEEEPETGSVDWYKWWDENGNAYWDSYCMYNEAKTVSVKFDMVKVMPACEYWLEWWTITITWESYTWSTVTDSNWHYSFDNIPVGDYTICEVQQEGWEQTYPTNNDWCHNVTVVSSSVMPVAKTKEAYPVHNGYNFGNREIRTYWIGWYKFNDLNQNANWERYCEEWQEDCETEPWLEWWTITITWESYTWSVVTDSEWYYRFNDLLEGEYTVCEEQQEGWAQSAPVDNDWCFVVQLGGEESCQKYDFGNYQERGWVSWFKFSDKDSDGVFDENEDKISWWVINITWDDYSDTTTTDENWNYSFENLLVGSYKVCEEQKSHWTQTYPNTNDGCYDVVITDNYTQDGKYFGNHRRWWSTSSHATCTNLVVETDLWESDWSIDFTCEWSSKTKAYMLDCWDGSVKQIKASNSWSATFTCDYADTDETYTPVCSVSETTTDDPASTDWRTQVACEWDIDFGNQITTHDVEEEIVSAWEEVDEIEWESSGGGIDKTYEDYTDKVNKINDIAKEEEKIGKSDLKALPKILLKTWTPLLDRTSVVNNKKIETSAPKMNASFVNDINFWKSRLDIADRSRNEYIVIPTSWLIIPVNYITKDSNDYKQLINWREIDVNKYLKSWVLIHPGTYASNYGEAWNKVIFGHSSYWKFDNGRYKTQFQKIIELDAWEEVWVYKMQANGEFKRFVYKVEKSFETNPTNVWVLNPGVWSNLTLITCTPVGWIEQRWVVQAKFVNEEKINIQNYLSGKWVPTKYKNAISKFIKNLQKLDNDTKKESILNVYSKVEQLEQDYNDNENLVSLLDYLKLKLAIVYQS